MKLKKGPTGVFLRDYQVFFFTQTSAIESVDRGKLNICSQINSLNWFLRNGHLLQPPFINFSRKTFFLTD